MKHTDLLSAVFPGAGRAIADFRHRMHAPHNPQGVLIQESSLAGFHYHRGHAIWPFLAVGEPLTLVRESANMHDRDAVAVYFRNDKLGYLPRRENRIVAQMLDRGQLLVATITRLREDENPWRRVRISVSLAQAAPSRNGSRLPGTASRPPEC